MPFPIAAMRPKGSGVIFTPASLPGLVAEWKFAEGSGQSVANSAGSIFPLQFGSAAGADANDPTWQSYGVNCSGAQYLSATDATGVSLSQFSLYLVTRWSGVPVSTQNVPLFNAANVGLGFFPAKDGKARLVFNNAVAADGNMPIGYDNAWHVDELKYDGTTLGWWIDGTPFLSATGATGSYALKTFTMGLLTSGTTGYWPGDYAYGLLYSQGHSAAQSAQLRSWLKSKMALRSVTLNSVIPTIVAFEGDSITAGSVAATRDLCYAYLAQQGLATKQIGPNFAVTGSTITNINNRATTVDASYQAGRTNILFLLDGANDTLLAAWFTALKAYCNARRATGWKVVLATILPQTTVGFNAKRNTANGWIRADNSFYDALCDFAADATMGPDAAASDGALYNAGIHPTTAGHAILGPLAATAIATQIP